MRVELHAASAFSFLEGASTPEEMAAEAARLGYEAVALCDRDGVYGAPRFHKAAREEGLRALAGCEVSLENGRRLTVLVESRRGYRNLCRLLTRMHLRAPKGEGRAGWDDIAEHAGGLVALLADTRDGDRLRSIFGRENLFVELQRHRLESQERDNRRRIAYAEAYGLPLAATGGARYARAASRRLFDALTCIRAGATLDTAGRLLEANAERRLRPPAELRRLFADLPEALDGARRLAERLEFTLEDLGYRFPVYPTPGGESEMAFLRQQVERAAPERFRPYGERQRAQIEHELRVIEKLELAGYFLVVWDIVEFARRQGILCQGRGSAANSAVCYALGITAVDPVKMELLFERFLSEERGEWPDIDIDLPSGEQRERVIQYVYERYGDRGAAMTANVITYRAKSAAREIGKVLGFPLEMLDRLSGCMHRFEPMEDPEQVKERLAAAGVDVAQPRVGLFARLCLEILDLPRHLGQHSGGMIVCQGRLDGVVPLENARMAGRVVAQWDKDDCADLGILKVDLLGLGMLSALENCIEILGERGVEVDLAHLPPDDPETYAMIQRADTVGVFQIESRAQMATLPRLRPACFYDLVVEVAIIRPGPIVGKMVHPYIDRRVGREPVAYPHPCLEPILKRTLGVPLFQEQLLRMAMTAAGFTGGEAEELRRAMGFKRSVERMRKIELRLREGLAANGIRGEAAEAIVRSITSFALYGFPESHAASFALLAYASSYLKAHYPAAFTAALLNCQPMGFYSPATLVKDAQRHGVRVRPIDVQASARRCTLEDGRTLRLGLMYTAGLRGETAERIARERREGGPFASLADFTRRARANARELASLAEVGALNALGEGAHRRDALWQIARLGRPAGPLLETLPEDGSGESPLRPMTAFERLDADYRGTGLTVGRHPMAYLREELAAQGYIPAAETPLRRHGAWTKVAGAVIVRQRPVTAKGVVFVSLEDETGIANVIVRAEAFERERLLWTRAPFLLVEGPLQKQDGVAHVRAERAAELEMETAAARSHDFH